MSRVWAGEKRSDGWVMECDTWPRCKTFPVGPRPAARDLPLEEFAAGGWFIARTHGDCCPACVKAAGGLDVLLAARAGVGGPGAPHSLMFDKEATS